MHDFKYIKNHLYCEKTPIAKIAKQVDTPVFIYSKKTLLDHYNKLDKAFSSVPHLICYSIKSNSNISVCRTLANAGSGFDIVSGGEFYRAIKSGANPRKIVFAGVGKTENEIKEALKKKILMFTVESIPELHKINKIAKSLNVKAPIALRVNPDVDAHTHKHITTGKKETKFGIDIGTARWLYNKHKAFPYINPIGIQIHIGSQITKPLPYVRAIKKIVPLIKEIKNIIPQLKYLDLGGGLGIVYEKEQPTTAKEFARAVLPHIKKLGLTIILEPGRFIAGNAGIMVAKVLYIKETSHKKFVIINAGMNDLIRPTLYSAYHEIVPIKASNNKTIIADIVGPICETGDYFALNRKIHTLKPCDLIAIMGAGAYGFSMSSNYNSRLRAAEVLVSGSSFKTIRKRETLKDLIRLEL